MKDFLDLTGASGAVYRFRVWPPGAPHLPIAGNYVFLRAEGEGFRVILLGATNDLSQARRDWPKAAERGASHVFTRLNVGRGGPRRRARGPGGRLQACAGGRRRRLK